MQGGTLPTDKWMNKQRVEGLLLIAKFKELLGPAASAVSAQDEDDQKPMVGRKRSLDEAVGASVDEWGPARDVRKCLDVLRRYPYTPVQ